MQEAVDDPSGEGEAGCAACSADGAVCPPKADRGSEETPYSDEDIKTGQGAGSKGLFSE